MSVTADVVVAGAGHNSLITAAYLARAGYECLVLDARPIPGGGAATEQLLGPEYRIDSCSTGHTIIRVNPLLTGDELGLHADYGLEYFEPDPVGHVAFPDGEQLTMWLDLDRTCDEIARFSKRDAEAYRRMIAEYVIGREFEDRHVQAFMIWQAFQTLVPVDAAGSGVNAYSIIFGRQGRSWSVPRGGSGALTDALTRYLEDRGSTVLCNRQVTSLVIEEGRCTGVETGDGERYTAARAVLSTIHVKQLVEMAPREAWGEEFVYGVDTYDVGMSGMACYLATDAPPEFQTPDGPRAAVSAGTVGWPEEVLALGRAVRDRPAHDEGVPWLLVATPTLVDPDRAPEGHHTIKLLSPQTWELPDGVKGWDDHKATVFKRQLEHVRRLIPALSDEHIHTSYVKSPADIERSNQHMIRGAFHGGDRSYPFSGRNRPVPGWADHRMPIPGLYQTGGTTSVGGSVTGVPGRNAAMVMLSDLGYDPEEVMAGAGRARAGSR